MDVRPEVGCAFPRADGQAVPLAPLEAAPEGAQERGVDTVGVHPDAETPRDTTELPCAPAEAVAASNGPVGCTPTEVAAASQVSAVNSIPANDDTGPESSTASDLVANQELTGGPGPDSVLACAPPGSGISPETVGEATATVGPSGAESDDATVVEMISEYQISLRDWRDSDPDGTDYAELAKSIQGWIGELWPRFIPTIDLKGTKVDQPPLLVVFEQARGELGHYVPGRNAAGLRGEISVNPRYASQRSELDLAATVLHELLHAFEDAAGSAPKARNNYHSAWFQKEARKLGIPCSKYGRDQGIQAGSPFYIWAQEKGLSGEAVLKDGSSARRPKPKRLRWTCGFGCVSVLVARGQTLRARCTRCDTDFSSVTEGTVS
jgi:hypothetical protein